MMEEISANPDLLTTLGFNRLEQDTSDSVRWVWYRKFLYCIDDLNFYIEVELEQFLSDDPFGDNLNDYSFNKIYMIITEEDLSDKEYGESGIEGKRNIRISSFGQLTRFLACSDGLGEFY